MDGREGRQWEKDWIDAGSFYTNTLPFSFVTSNHPPPPPLEANWTILIIFHTPSIAAYLMSPSSFIKYIQLAIQL